MFPRVIPQDVKNKVHEVTQDVFECKGKVETEKVRAALEEDYGICFFNTIELEKLIKEGLDKQKYAYENNGTAQEVSVQEQYKFVPEDSNGKYLDNEKCSNYSTCSDNQGHASLGRPQPE